MRVMYKEKRTEVLSKPGSEIYRTLRFHCCCGTKDADSINSPVNKKRRADMA